MIPFWLMLGCNVKEEKITILGFSDKDDTTALEEAIKRAKPGDSVRVFGLHNEVAPVAEAMRTWLVDCGAPEEMTNQIIAQVANDIRGMLKK